MQNLDNFLADCPGLVGEIARFVDAKFSFTQPAIALASAFAFVGSLKSQRFHCDSVQPNLYCLAVATSGSGKSQAQSAIEMLSDKVKIRNLIMGKPASDAGLLNALRDTPRQLLIWDEFGLALSELSKAQASYRVLILSTIMDLFSKAGTVFRGKQYANQERIDIHNPFLSILAASTPNRFFSSLNDNFVEDGFLPRWLIFFSNNDDKVKIRKPDRSAPSVALLKAIYDLEHIQKKTSGGNLQKGIEPQCQNIRFEMEQVWRQTEMDYQFKLRDAKTDIEKVFRARSFEQYSKLCIALADEQGFVNDQAQIFASDLLDHLTSEALRKCRELLGQTEKQKVKDKFRDLIQPGEAITQKVLSARAWRLNLSRPEKLQLIDELLEGETWRKDFQFIEGSQKKSCVFSRIR